MQTVFHGLLRGYRLSSIRWMVGQAWLESAYMTDDKALTYNNPFGMSRVYVRPTNQAGYIDLADGNSFGTYKSIGDAVEDRFEWDEYFSIEQSKYAKDVSKRYHNSKTYADSVSAVTVQGVGTSIGILLATIPLTYLLIKNLF